MPLLATTTLAGLLLAVTAQERPPPLFESAWAVQFSEETAIISSGKTTGERDERAR